MQKLFKNFVTDESGATAIEYGLIAALIAVAMIAGVSTLGQSVEDKFEDISGALDAVVDDEAAADAGTGGD